MYWERSNSSPCSSWDISDKGPKAKVKKMKIYWPFPYQNGCPVIGPFFTQSSRRHTLPGSPRSELKKLSHPIIVHQFRTLEAIILNLCSVLYNKTTHNHVKTPHLHKYGPANTSKGDPSHRRLQTRSQAPTWSLCSQTVAYSFPGVHNCMHLLLGNILLCIHLVSLDPRNDDNGRGGHVPGRNTRVY